MNRFADLPLCIKTHPRAKRVLVKLVPRQGVEVVTPPGFDPRRIPGVLQEKRAWIERTARRLRDEGVPLEPVDAVVPDSVRFSASGKHYDVHCVVRPGRVVLSENATRLLLAGPDDVEARLDALRRFVVRSARAFVLPRLDALSRRIDIPYEALRIRRQKTRWGSCSAHGTISLNAKLLFLPPELADHLLLHELCHVRHMNHSPAYWALVTRHQPDCRALENRLKRSMRCVPDWFA